MTLPSTNEKLVRLLRDVAAQVRQQFGDLGSTDAERESAVDRALAVVAASAGVALSFKRRSRSSDDAAGALLNAAVRLWTRKQRASADILQMPRPPIPSESDLR